ncbi:MAG: FeoB-associated Cys-rich membrane protein [Bacteroidetes bacterium]|nr:FeoB-associated Cys-rich membrane protein [Bacteroidota bacterium]MDA0938431.1 FeoB-associated Cys-rich membrane protein [Bacteroidota bacterium]MDA1345221.1 FeoB-associated Cys-rich membrane protein [Bacteroidota bacterium]
MDWLQNILVVLLVVFAATILLRRFVFKKKNKGDCDTNCDCH